MTTPQPTRSKAAPREQRRFDQTALREGGHGQIVHRDYAAHFFRWGFAKQSYIQHDQTVVLDVGCGPDLPLMKVLLGGGPKQLPARYVGVDLNKISYKGRPSRASIYEKTDFTQEVIYKHLVEEHGYFGLITNFEVIEHMDVPDGRHLLKCFREVIADTGTLLLSTPVFNGTAARNHIHEYEIPELQAEIEAAGFRVERRYGTFASWNDIKKVASPEHLATAKAIKEYYDGDVVSTFLAPLYPDASRNNLWVCKPVVEASSE